MDSIATAIQACEWGSSKFLILSSNVFDPLIYYSHFTAFVLSLGLGTLVFIRNRKILTTRLLFVVTVLLSIWLFSDLVVWATEFSKETMFFWSLTNLIEPFVYAFSLYFVYVFISGKDLPFKYKVAVFFPLLITVVLTPTKFALLGYDLSNCDRDAVEGPLAYYAYVLELIYMLIILGLGTISYLKKKTWEERTQVLIVTLGTVFFLLSFAFGNVIGSLFSTATVLGDYSWTIGQYGLFGVPVFVALLAYIIVRFKTFNIGLLAAQALILGLVAILGLEFAFVRTKTNQILVSITLVLTGILGIMLIRSVRREIDQREHIELLAKDLELSNKQQVALIHFITHQLKGFVSKSRNIFAMISEGDYGVVPDTMKPMIDEGFASSTKGAQTIQEILNAANIKNGKVAYTMLPFDLSALVASIVATHKSSADEKGVALTFTAPESPVMFTGDQTQLENALKNLIDNTIKYTPQGSIKVSLTKDEKVIRFMTEDTGVGISKEDMAHLFTEGGHGAESMKVNVDSTGFGLYIVKNIIEGHGGKVWAESEGAGKGARFVVELPV